jgi:hypothetical protein
VLHRLTSRKFLLAAATVAGLLAARQYGEAVAIVIAYIGVEGALDRVAAAPEPAPVQAKRPAKTYGF